MDWSDSHQSMAPNLNGIASHPITIDCTSTRRSIDSGSSLSNSPCTPASYHSSSLFHRSQACGSSTYFSSPSTPPSLSSKVSNRPTVVPPIWPHCEPSFNFGGDNDSATVLPFQFTPLSSPTPPSPLQLSPLPTELSELHEIQRLQHAAFDRLKVSTTEDSFIDRMRAWEANRQPDDQIMSNGLGLSGITVEEEWFDRPEEEEEEEEELVVNLELKGNSTEQTKEGLSELIDRMASGDLEDHSTL